MSASKKTATKTSSKSKKPAAKKSDSSTFKNLALVLVRPSWSEVPESEHQLRGLRAGVIDMEALAKESPVLLVGGASGRVAVPHSLRLAFEEAIAATVAVGGVGTQAYRIVKHGMPAALDALADLTETPEHAPKTNALSAIGNVVSVAVRRAVLLSVADDAGWSPSRMAPILGLGSASDVLRAFKDLAPDELAAARRDGRIARGGDRTKATDEKS